MGTFHEAHQDGSSMNGPMTLTPQYGPNDNFSNNLLDTLETSKNESSNYRHSQALRQDDQNYFNNYFQEHPNPVNSDPGFYSFKTHPRFNHMRATKDPTFSKEKNFFYISNSNCSQRGPNFYTVNPPDKLSCINPHISSLPIYSAYDSYLFYPSPISNNCSNPQIISHLSQSTSNIHFPYNYIQMMESQDFSQNKASGWNPSLNKVYNSNYPKYNIDQNNLNQKQRHNSNIINSHKSYNLPLSQNQNGSNSHFSQIKKISNQAELNSDNQFISKKVPNLQNNSTNEQTDHNSQIPQTDFTTNQNNEFVSYVNLYSGINHDFRMMPIYPFFLPSSIIIPSPNSHSVQHTQNIMQSPQIHTPISPYTMGINPYSSISNSKGGTVNREEQYLPIGSYQMNMNISKQQHQNTNNRKNNQYMKSYQQNIIKSSSPSQDHHIYNYSFQNNSLQNSRNNYISKSIDTNLKANKSNSLAEDLESQSSTETVFKSYANPSLVRKSFQNNINLKFPMNRSSSTSSYNPNQTSNNPISTSNVNTSPSELNLQYNGFDTIHSSPQIDRNDISNYPDTYSNTYFPIEQLNIYENSKNQIYFNSDLNSQVQMSPNPIINEESEIVEASYNFDNNILSEMPASTSFSNTLHDAEQINDNYTISPSSFEFNQLHQQRDGENHESQLIQKKHTHLIFPNSSRNIEKRSSSGPPGYISDLASNSNINSTNLKINTRGYLMPFKSTEETTESKFNAEANFCEQVSSGNFISSNPHVEKKHFHIDSISSPNKIVKYPHLPENKESEFSSKQLPRLIEQISSSKHILKESNKDYFDDLSILQETQLNNTHSISVESVKSNNILSQNLISNYTSNSMKLQNSSSMLAPQSYVKNSEILTSATLNSHDQTQSPPLSLIASSDGSQSTISHDNHNSQIVTSDLNSDTLYNYSGSPLQINTSNSTNYIQNPTPYNYHGDYHNFYPPPTPTYPYSNEQNNPICRVLPDFSDDFQSSKQFNFDPFFNSFSHETPQVYLKHSLGLNQNMLNSRESYIFGQKSNFSNNYKQKAHLNKEIHLRDLKKSKHNFNLTSFYSSTTPVAQIDPIKDFFPINFSLSNLWDSLEEASIYGLEIPFMDFKGNLGSLICFPFLSALVLYSNKNPNKSCFQYIETAAPHKRKPLVQLIKELSSHSNNSETDNTEWLMQDTKNLSDQSWIAIYWKTMQRDFNGSQSPTFLVFYRLKTIYDKNNCLAILEIFGALPDKIDLELWAHDSPSDIEKTRHYFENERSRLRNWLRSIEIHHSDFEYFAKAHL